LAPCRSASSRYGRCEITYSAIRSYAPARSNAQVHIHSPICARCLSGCHIGCRNDGFIENRHSMHDLVPRDFAPSCIHALTVIGCTLVHKTNTQCLDVVTCMKYLSRRLYCKLTHTQTQAHTGTHTGTHTHTPQNTDADIRHAVLAVPPGPDTPACRQFRVARDAVQPSLQACAMHACLFLRLFARARLACNHACWYVIVCAHMHSASQRANCLYARMHVYL
jgi:hypothetical protein